MPGKPYFFYVLSEIGKTEKQYSIRGTNFTLSVEKLTEYVGYVTAVNLHGEEGTGSTTFTFHGPRRPKAPTNLKDRFIISNELFQKKEKKFIKFPKPSVVYKTDRFIRPVSFKFLI